MKIKGLLEICKINDNNLEEVIKCHPKQIITSDVNIPVWKIKYSYKTQRDNEKEAIKYIFRHASEWDSVDNDFILYIKDFNEKFPDRQLSNVEILDAEYLGELVLELE